MDAQSRTIHEGCVDKRLQALSYSHTLSEQGQLATHKRVISSEKIDSGLPLSASHVCVTHVIQSFPQRGCRENMFPLFYTSAFLKKSEVNLGLESKNTIHFQMHIHLSVQMNSEL